MNNNTYDVHLFTSKCCDAFLIHEGPTQKCSRCQSVVGQIKDDEILTITVKFNETSTNNSSGDILNAFKNKASRFSTDPTLEICNIKCPKCGSLCRYAETPQKNLIYICSNPKCRYVHDS